MYDTGNPKLVLCDNLEEGGGEDGGSRVQYWGHTCDIYVWQKTS